MTGSQGYVVFLFQTLVAHFIFLYAIFDIYFTSPVLHGMPQHVPKVDSVSAKRLVLFIADGLRADRCFDAFDEDVNFKFLSQKIEGEGVWRVSHTRVPTESRPGHVAIIAGLYEDVSAVAKGWKENPVEFDSVFNQSKKTWAFGSPDIVHMFAKDKSQRNVITETYPAEYEDFAGSNLSFLDTWVFDKAEAMLDRSLNDKQLYEELHQEQIIIFLHLLGIDTNGHRHNPSSVQYNENVRIVDNGIKRFVEKLESYYQDRKTAYIVTSDHGMTEWGTHGAGHPHETVTPFIAWGSGVASESISVEKAKEIQHSHSILQADIAPFMSSLLRLAVPANNVGILHADMLSCSLKDKAEYLYANTLQILEQFTVSLKRKQETTFKWLFRQYQVLSISRVKDIMRDIRQKIQMEKYEGAIKTSEELIQVALDGISYYHRYDRFFLGLCIVLGYIGWMLYTLCYLLNSFLYLNDKHSRFGSSKGWWIIRVALLLVLLINHLPWTHIVYGLLPTVPFEYVLSQRKILIRFVSQVVFTSLKNTTLVLLFMCAGLELLIYSFFYRELLSFVVLLLAASNYKRNFWLYCSLPLAVFPLLPVVGRDANYYVVVTAGMAALILIGCQDLKAKAKYTHMFLLVCTMCNILYTHLSISQGQGLPFICRITSWVILILAFAIPLVSDCILSQRIIVLECSIFTLYLLFSTSYEGWFALALIVFIQCWIKNETVNKPWEEAPQALALDAVRISFIYLFLIILAFFGTGNIASLNSFEPASVFCFVTVFSPFNMAGLMMLKIVLPFLLVSCGYLVIAYNTNTQHEGVFLIILIMSDFMGLHFLMWVKDYGSWLEIGSSISHYVIVISITLFLIILTKLSQLLMTFSASRFSYIWRKKLKA